MRRNKGTLFYHLSCEKAWFLSDFVKVWEWYLSEKKLLCMPFFTPTQMLRAISVQFFCFLSTSKHQKPSPSFQDACLISVTHVTMLSSDEIKPWTGLIEHRQLDGLAFPRCYVGRAKILLVCDRQSVLFPFHPVQCCPLGGETLTE